MPFRKCAPSLRITKPSAQAGEADEHDEALLVGAPAGEVDGPVERHLRLPRRHRRAGGSAGGGDGGVSYEPDFWVQEDWRDDGVETLGKCRQDRS